MKDKKKRTGKNGGFYIALCGCAVVVALMSYVGNVMRKPQKLPEMQNISLEDISGEPLLKDNLKEYETEIFDTEKKTPEEPEVITIEPEEPLYEEEKEVVTEQDFFEETEMTATAEEVDEFLPALPVSGKVLAEYSGENLVYYENLDDWRAHSGIDLEASVGDDVYICESGIIEKIYFNNLGGCILVDHKNGYKSLYANLGEVDLVNVGDEMSAGETIARVGDTAVGDKTTESHVHFELIYEGKNVNPLDIITIE